MSVCTIVTTMYANCLQIIYIISNFAIWLSLNIMRDIDSC